MGQRAITKQRSKRILHVGCGTEHIPEWLDGDEVRLDIDPAVKPDIVAPMTDMGAIGAFEAIYCSHALEHLYPHDVPMALAEFLRVLRPGGVVLIFVPNLEYARPTNEVLYESPVGPITGFDLFYGYTPWLKENLYMAHHSGFIGATLRAALEKAGFQGVRTVPDCWNLLGMGVKPA